MIMILSFTLTIAHNISHTIHKQFDKVLWGDKEILWIHSNISIHWILKDEQFDVFILHFSDYLFSNIVDFCVGWEITKKGNSQLYVMK